MSTKPNFNSYAFVIDTEQYAGNFERDLCAFVTGTYGECGVGSEYSKDDIQKKFSECDDCNSYVINIPDEYGCYRPCSIYESPDNGQYKSVAIFFNEKPTDEQILIMKERSIQFQDARRNSGHSWDKEFKLDIVGYRLVKFVFEEKITNI